jgi:hypothetical protein
MSQCFSPIFLGEDSMCRMWSIEMKDEQWNVNEYFTIVFEQTEKYRFE